MIVRYAYELNIDNALVVDVLNTVIKKQGTPNKLIIHSYLESQYPGDDFEQLFDGIKRSGLLNHLGHCKRFVIASVCEAIQRRTNYWIASHTLAMTPHLSVLTINTTANKSGKPLFTMGTPLY